MPAILKFFKMTFFLLLLVAVAAGAFLTLGSYSDGVRVGEVVKLSKKGFFFKTWEGELYQGFIETQPSGASAGVATRTWVFSVKDDPKLIADLNKVIEKTGKAKIHYHEKLALLPWIGETKYIVDAVELIK